ncbi:MAG: protein-(glutamine-N5) methyltransferase, release factor-specific [Flavobacteriales bacterium]|nr:MAG: protein-(glutamine-N5) methyltransferase, release factor-specific [Flavobacteriales bacterium]
MKIFKITVIYAVNHFKKELKEFYYSSEIEQMLYIVFLHYFNLNRIDLTLSKNHHLLEQDFNKITKVIDELKQHKPLAHIIGEWEFYGINLKINRHTLIPRQETEELVQMIINDNNNEEQLFILDIGTGTGCIALALKKNLPQANVHAFDVSWDALEIAIENAKRNELTVTFKNVDILKWKSQNEKYNVIVSNPPYITKKEKHLMAKNILDYEPHLALFVENGESMLFYDAIAEYALRHLKRNGKLYFEINENYRNDVMGLLKDKKFKNINIVKDINGKDRIVSCNLD